jgi:hypothetical protein
MPGPTSRCRTRVRLVHHPIPIRVVASRHVHNQAGSLEACNDGVGGAVQVPPAFRLLRFVVEAARRLITHQTARSAHASSHRSSRAATGYAAALADARALLLRRRSREDNKLAAGAGRAGGGAGEDAAGQGKGGDGGRVLMLRSATSQSATAFLFAAPIHHV